MFEELFNRFPGLQNLYENAVANGYTGDPEQLLKEYGQDFSQNIGGLGSMMGIQPQAMPQTMPPAALPMPQTMVDPTVMAYQRGLLSGSVQPQNPYGFGLATSPYYGYSRNPYGNLLY